MKSFAFINVLLPILAKAVAIETVRESCESKVELRAVLLSCPVKDTGCDDDDPLSQAMAAEEAQIFQSSPKNCRSLKDEKERGFPNAVKDCKRKLIITIKIKNVGKIPCDDEYIVVDHVFDPLTGGRGRLLSPIVLKLRQEQMIQLYGLQFQRVVNSDPFEEEKETEKMCSTNPDSPTCGVAMYNGKPIPFSEGFCCSCDPVLNTKRQLSTVSRGDSFIYQDSKLISQISDRDLLKKTKGIVDSGTVKLKLESIKDNEAKNVEDDKDKEESCPMRGLSCDDLPPNYLMEHDRKIVCDKSDFLRDLCELHNEKKVAELNDFSYNSGLESKKSYEKKRPLENSSKSELIGAKIANKDPFMGVADNPIQNEEPPNILMGLKKDSGSLKSLHHSSKDYLTEIEKSHLVTRGKRENSREHLIPKDENKFLVNQKLRKSWNKIANSKDLLKNRRKRLLSISHKQFRETEIGCRDSEEFKNSIPEFPRDNMKVPPPKYFFFHDKKIVQPGNAGQSTSNATCQSSNEVVCGNAGNCAEYFTIENKKKSSQNQKDSQNALGNGIYSTNLNEKLNHQDTKKEPTNHWFPEKNLLGDAVISSESRSSGKSEGKSFKESSKLRSEQSEDDKLCVNKLSDTKKSNAENWSRAKIDSTPLSEFKKKTAGNEEEAGQTNSFDVKTIKNFFLRGDSKQNLLEPNSKSYLLIKKRGKEKLSEAKSSQQRPVAFENKNKEAERNFKGTMENLKNVEADELFKKKEIQGFDFENEKKLEDTTSENKDLRMLQKNSDDWVKPFLKIRNNPKDIKINSNHERMYKRNRLKMDHSSKNFVHERRKHFRGGSKAEGECKSNRPYLPNYEAEGNVDFNFEIIRKPIPQLFLPPNYPSNSLNYVKPRVEGNRNKYFLQPESYFANDIKRPVSNHPQYVYVPRASVQNYYLPTEKKTNSFLSPVKYSFVRDSDPKLEYEKLLDLETRNSFSREERKPFDGRTGSYRFPEIKFERSYYRKSPSRHYYIAAADHKIQKKYASTMEEHKYLNKPNDEKNEVRKFEQIALAELGDFESPKSPRLRREAPGKKMAKDFKSPEYLPANNFGSTNEFFKSEFGATEIDSIYYSSSEGIPEFVSKLDDNLLKNKEDKNGQGEKRQDTVKRNLPLTSLDSSEDSALKIFCRDRLEAMGKGKAKKRQSDSERLKRSYAAAADYVIKKAEIFGLKGKRQANERSNGDVPRTNPRCKKNSYVGEYTQETAHCMRFGDLWYSVYLIKKPVIAQIVGLQVFDKHGLCDGSTQWRDLTKGKMIRIGTFLPKAEDELPTISMSFVGGKTKKSTTSIDPDNYLLLIPSHLSDPSKASFYPQFNGSPEEYLVVDSKLVSNGGNCNMIGTSFEAFARQSDRCSRPKGSCLKRQPVDLWREDMEARIRGKRGKYFVENFGTVPNSPIKTYTNLTGEFLALEYYGEYTSTIEIEVKADFNAMVRKGSNAQIPTVYVDGTYPKKTRIILSVLNIGLTSSYFRPRLGDCPPDLDPAWCPLEGPLVTIPPQQRHDFRLDLSGALPPNKIHVTVQVLNQLNKKVAFRKIVIKKGDRCICAFHCKCNCIGNADGRTCHRLSLEEYRGAGYIGSFPFRGAGASSASESIRTHLRVIFLTAVYVLLFMGVTKGIIGIFYRRMGIAGMRVMVGPRKISKYYESELECCPVLFDDCGFPVHPTTCLPVQIVPLGIWFLLLSQPCCTVVVEMCDGSSGQSEGGNDTGHKCSSPLLNKTPQPTCVSYTMTTVNSRKNKGDEYPSYLPYKGDDDPLEDDDTEFVLQEMKRYRKKVALL